MRNLMVRRDNDKWAARWVCGLILEGLRQFCKNTNRDRKGEAGLIESGRLQLVVVRFGGTRRSGRWREGPARLLRTRRCSRNWDLCILIVIEMFCHDSVSS
jgi:hypothetical protein